MKDMGFQFLKRQWKALLMNKDDIVLWRRKYLPQIKSLHSKGCKTYSLDETWLSEGHVTFKVWVDSSVKSRQ
jgi:hypothetical protein